MAEHDGPARQWSWSAPASEGNDEAESLDISHKKRLARILRFIAQMHHSNGASAGISFVNETPANHPPPEVLRDDDILFATEDFRHILTIDQDGTLFKKPPFSFYKAAASPSSRKRTFAGSIKRSLLSCEMENTQTTWLRITRLAAEPSPRTTPAIREYLKSWQESSGTDVPNLLRIERLKDPPKVPAGFHSGEIKSFLRQYKKYLRRAAMRTALEPLYNRLFEWLQAGQGELVWGMGTATMQSDGTTIHGPLLEVLVEVELSRDGALLVRPRPHTGVALNREVVAALTTGHETLSNLHRTVSELETDQLSPGEPSTYTPLLKRMAHELSSGGTFVSACNPPERSRNASKLIVTDAWCLYCRPHPSTVWARDASVLAEQVLLQRGTLPLAAWSLTHGPAVLASVQNGNDGSSAMSLNVVWGRVKSVLVGANDSTVRETSSRPLLALPTSDSQNRIADLLLSQKYPAVICEGPPGTGKTHTIANMVCAYLCQGKRVLVTSKAAPALSVLRERLPKCVQELCVDVSMSESAGMRQLQQTVERLADRISCISSDVQEEQRRLVQRTIRELENELDDIDRQLLENAERKRQLVQNPSGQQLVDLSFQLFEAAPWLIETISSWTVADTNALLGRTRALYVEADDPLEKVSGYESPPADGLISLVASHAGEKFSMIKDAVSRAVASIPVLGSVSGIDEYREQLTQQLAAIQIDGNVPESPTEWTLVLRALQLDKAVHDLHAESLKNLIGRESWPSEEIYEINHERKRFRKSFVDNLEKAAKFKELEWESNAQGEIGQSIKARQLDSRRSKIPPKIQHLAEDLVEATVVSQLSRMFSPEAQSALIRFAQIAGKAKFSKSSQASKMSQRQRRHRQEYLDAFEKCVRYIPCWILTSTQISDYLPAEFGLFDLVVIDEASQSDITALPGMLRGKQWLIVGDGKQVSPSESFLSETQIDSLRAALPESPLNDSLLPGRSFFDLCAQAFPRGRVVLREHFRCAPEIIAFSNEIFYDGRLVPLRLPTSAERLTPSLMDIRVNGSKTAKINEEECNTIVNMIRDFVAKSDSDTFPRTIGVISLVGNEQSRLIRGRLLDVIGPQKYKEHDILIGDPPTFQGAERDIIFLSMVCSPGRVPTQSQLMYAQRANVALSRARDRMVLVRSIDSSHVPSGDDVKIPILEFFAEAATTGADSDEDENDGPRFKDSGLFSFRMQAQSLLEKLLRAKGYSVRRMGVVWSDAVCVEDKASGGTRAAVCFECAGESTEEWSRLVKQQKSIERVGWKTLRVDGLSFLVDSRGTFRSIETFLRNTGVLPSMVEANEEEVDEEQVEERGDDGQGEEAVDVDVDVARPIVAHAEEDIIVVSSDDDDDSGSVSSSNQGKAAATKVEIKMEEDEEMDPAQYGDLANLEFLRGSVDNADEDDASRSVMDDPYHQQQGHRRRTTRSSRNSNASNRNNNEDSDGDDNMNDNDKDDNDHWWKVGSAAAGSGVARAPSDEYGGEDDSSDDDSYRSGRPTSRKRQRRTRLDKYSRDGRWYPGKTRVKDDEDDEEKEWYDSESDLPSSSFIKPAAVLRDSSSGHLADANEDSNDETPLL